MGHSRCDGDIASGVLQEYSPEPDGVVWLGRLVSVEFGSEMAKIKLLLYRPLNRRVKTNFLSFEAASYYVAQAGL